MAGSIPFLPHAMEDGFDLGRKIPYVVAIRDFLRFDNLRDSRDSFVGYDRGTHASGRSIPLVFLLERFICEFIIQSSR